MTSRLYYTDATLRAFDASVVESGVHEGRPFVFLDRTAFYPTSGGQPFDTGRLGGVAVVDVVDEDDGRIRHVLEGALAAGGTVHGEVDWPRRFDHMQQHTGQHILSAAFDRLYGVRTVSFHLGASESTIDLAREVSAAEAAASEDAANAVVWEDRPVTIRFAAADEATALPLRKEPARTGELRLVEVADFDLSACGGTHVPHTGRIGMIAVSRAERFKGGSRMAFVCGGRALGRFRDQRDVIERATRMLSIGAAELPASVERLQADVKRFGRAVRQLQEETAGVRAEALRREAETIGGVRVVLQEERGWDAGALKILAAAIVRESGHVVVLAGEGQPTPVVAARAADAPFDAAAWMARAAAALGGRGGGRPELAQGGIPASPDTILAWARRDLASGA